MPVHGAAKRNKTVPLKLCYGSECFDTRKKLVNRNCRQNFPMASGVARFHKNYFYKQYLPGKNSGLEKCF